MKLTPLDLVQQNFTKAFRGYDSKQVDHFLDSVRAEWETLLRQLQDVEEQLRHRETQVEQYRERERTLQETLVTAQRMSEEMKISAKKEADIIINQAELQADKIIHQAHTRLTQIIDEINDAKRQRAELEGKLRGILEQHIRLLDLNKEVRETPQIENVAVLHRST